ncbi:hypothetical protein F7R05_20560 [Pseudomonas koreensis]|nr:hypothetical protein F7R05_20560 [Pseudomonas koreensis]
MRRSTCRSEPARDSNRSDNIDVECQAAIASRLTPTGQKAETKTERSHAPFFVQVEITCRPAFP